MNITSIGLLTFRIMAVQLKLSVVKNVGLETVICSSWEIWNLTKDELHASPRDHIYAWSMIAPDTSQDRSSQEGDGKILTLRFSKHVMSFRVLQYSELSVVCCWVSLFGLWSGSTP